MADDERRLIEVRYRSLCHRFAALSDARDFDATVGLFTEDGALERRGERFIGRAAVLGALAGRPKDLLVRHHLTTMAVHTIDGNSASGVCYFILFQLADWSGARENNALNGPAAVGEYQDMFRLTPEGWKFVDRTAYLTFRQ